MSDAFTEMWLRVDTYVGNITPSQKREVRELCRRFFEKGRKFEREKHKHVGPAPREPESSS